MAFLPSALQGFHLAAKISLFKVDCILKELKILWNINYIYECIELYSTFTGYNIWMISFKLNWIIYNFMNLYLHSEWNIATSWICMGPTFLRVILNPFLLVDATDRSILFKNTDLWWVNSCVLDIEINFYLFFYNFVRILIFIWYQWSANPICREHWRARCQGIVRLTVKKCLTVKKMSRLLYYNNKCIEKIF